VKDAVRFTDLPREVKKGFDMNGFLAS